MLEVKDGKIFVEGVETIDAELIGMAFLDFSEDISKNGMNWKSSLVIDAITNYESKIK